MDFRIRRAEQTDVAEMAACFAAAYAPARAEGVSLPPVSEGLDEDIRDHLVSALVNLLYPCKLRDATISGCHFLGCLHSYIAKGKE